MKKLGFGMMRLPLLDTNQADSIDYRTLNQMVDSYLEQGFTYFDTAWMYCGGKSEEAVNKALVSRHPRESFTLTTKLPAYLLKTEADRETVFQTQLNRTGAGYFDYYWLHDVNAESLPIFERLNCFQYLQEKKAAGLVRHIGFSYHDGPELLDEILTKHPEVECVQIQLNYLDWDSLGVQSRKCYEVITRHRKPVIVMEPVKGGTLAKLPDEAEALLKAQDSKMSLPSWAIRFAASLENVMVVLSGMSDMQQLLDNTSYMRDFVPLTEDEFSMMLRCSDIINRTISIPCTGCSYCTVNCPQNIAIPKYFSLYNAEKQELESKTWTPQPSYYEHLTTRFGKASDCLRCGACEAMCPQHLPIRKYLEDVADLFETE